MFLITTKMSGETGEALGKGAFQRRLHKHGRFTYFSEGQYESRVLGDMVILSSGHALCGWEELRLEKYVNIDDLAIDLKEAVGYFSYILIDKLRVIIISSLYRHIDVFYANTEKEVVISSNLPALLEVTGKRPLNANFMFQFVNEECRFGGDTIFEGVHHVPLGEAVIIEPPRQNRREAWNIPTPRSVDFVEELCRIVEVFAANEERIFVQFSGGLDSSLVLHIAQKINPDCVAQHLLSTEDTASEVDIARQVAKEFGVELFIHDSPVLFTKSRTSFDTERLANSPFDIHPLAPDPANRDFAYDVQLQAAGIEGGFFLTGQGGDYVFLQNPSPRVGFDGYLERGLRGFIKAIKTYSQLKKIPVLPLIRHNIQTTFLQARARSIICPARIGHLPAPNPYPAHALLRQAKEGSAKFDHLQSILTGLYQIKPNDGDRYRVLHPLFMQNILAGVIDEPVNRMFTADYDRIQIREAFSKSSGSPVAWRRTKRPSSGLVFAFFRNNEKLVKSFLLGGLVSTTLNVDDSWIENQITNNAAVVTTDEAGILLNLLRLEIFVRSYENYAP